MKLLAKVAKGHQVASGSSINNPFGASTIALQKPFFQALGLDLTEYVNGTINAEICNCRQIQLLKHDYYFPDIQWCHGFKAESFYFARCQIIYRQKRYQAFIYQPDKQGKIGHFQPENTLELLAEPVENLSYGNQITIEIADNYLKVSR